MKKLLFTYQDIDSVNIGDYIQSVAAKQYFNDDNYRLINRDELSLYSGDIRKVIMNGWFTYKPENWPPNKSIDPLFVAFHINDLCKNELLCSNSVDYLKKYEPIGCRDIGTRDMLVEKGVNAYYSGCLTTTLSLSFNNHEIERNGIYIVDPLAYMPNGKGIVEIIKTILYFIFYFRRVFNIINRLKENNNISINFSRIGVIRILLITNWYLLLRNLVDEEVFSKAKFITQYYEKDEYLSDSDRFDRANELLELYSRAEYVITSRIHCALPCLGFKTPVVFVRNLSEDEKSICRFKGIEDLFNVVYVKNNKIYKSFFKEKLTLKLDFKNPTAYLKYANNLINKCKDFMNI